MTSSQLKAIGETIARLDYEFNSACPGKVNIGKMLLNPAQQDFQFWTKELLSKYSDEGDEISGASFAFLLDLCDKISMPTTVEQGNIYIAYCKAMSKLRQSDNRKRLGSLIASARKEAGLTQRQLAEKCGVSYSNIAKIETAKYNVSIDIAFRILNAMGKTFSIEDI